MRLFTLAACTRMLAAALFIIVSSVACAGPSTYDGASDGPAIWKIDKYDGKGHVYLLGSVHMMKKDLVWYTPKIRRSLAQANDVIFEITLDDAGQSEMTKFMAKEGYYPEDQSLKANIDAALFDKTAAMATHAGIAPNVLDRLKPWYAATVLSLIYVEALGYDPDSGVESFIKKIAKKRRLPIVGLESVSDQMYSLARNTPEVQETLLRNTVKELGELNNELDGLTSAWVKGDTGKLAEMLVEPISKDPEAYQSLVVKRNRSWIPKIKALMDEPGTQFVVVGVMHLVGRDGVIQVLKDDGVSVKRF